LWSGDYSMHSLWDVPSTPPAAPGATPPTSSSGATTSSAWTARPRCSSWLAPVCPLRASSTVTLRALPLDDGEVDVAVCALALAHLDDLRPPIAELARARTPPHRLRRRRGGGRARSPS